MQKGVVRVHTKGRELGTGQQGPWCSCIPLSLVSSNYSGHLGTACRRGYSGHAQPPARWAWGSSGLVGCISEAQQRAAAKRAKESQRERQFAGGREYLEQDSGLGHWHVPGACRPARPQPPPSLFRNTLLHLDLHFDPVTSPRLIAASACHVYRGLT
jgi:hypothetical protein